MIHETITRLEAVGRQRALTEEESATLQDAILRSIRAEGRQRQFWSAKEDRALRLGIHRKSVAKIAEALGRTERAVWQRMQRLRRLGKLGYISPENGIGRYPRERFKSEPAENRA